jgi:putative ABC transport system permease protein
MLMDSGMFGYYLALALRSLKRNVVLTVLMISAIGVGIGASMTTLTVFRAMSGDPIPRKSAQLFTPQIDNWGPTKQGIGTGDHENFQEQISYDEAMDLLNARAAHRQAAMYRTGLALLPTDPQLKPYQVHVRATTTDMFPMFEIPFLYGSPWGAAEDASHASVVVLTRELNDKVFGGVNSVGKTVNLDNQQYRVVGVVDHWDPVPKFYDLNNNKYGKVEELFMPLSHAIESHMMMWGNFNCPGEMGEGWEGRLHSECVWLQYWAELPTAGDVARYRSFLNNYAADQQKSGRFSWPAHTRLRDVREWLDYEHVVSDEVRILVLVSFSFLFVCLLNAMGLMLAKIMGRTSDISVRRALGANRRAMFSQCLIEAGVIGVAGGLVGIGLTGLGLVGLRSIFSEQAARLAVLNISDVSIALALAISSTIVAGLYPTWRAMQVQPAWQLKAQ